MKKVEEDLYQTTLLKDSLAARRALELVSIPLSEFIGRTTTEHGHGSTNGLKVMRALGVLHREFVKGCRTDKESAICTDWLKHDASQTTHQATATPALQQPVSYANRSKSGRTAGRSWAFYPVTNRTFRQTSPSPQPTVDGDRAVCMLPPIRNDAALHQRCLALDIPSASLRPVQARQAPPVTPPYTETCRDIMALGASKRRSSFRWEWNDTLSMAGIRVAVG